jgi:hypothetical protein
MPSIQRAVQGGGHYKPDGELEILCNKCFSLIPASSVLSHLKVCVQAAVKSPAELLKVKLQKLRGSLEGRLRSAATQVEVMRYLSQLRYHIDTALKWGEDGSVNALAEHTLVQVKQLTQTARYIAPAVLIFTRRVENVIVQLDKELRQASSKGDREFSGAAVDLSLIVNRSNQDDDVTSAIEVTSVVTAVDSDTGTQTAETQVTEDARGDTDVADLAGADKALTLKNEDEQRRWFYSQCLTAKLQCTEKSQIRRVLISDLYVKVKQDGVPIDGWTEWIKQNLTSGDGAAAPAPVQEEATPTYAGDPRSGSTEPPYLYRGYPTGAQSSSPHRFGQWGHMVPGATGAFPR